MNKPIYGGLTTGKTFHLIIGVILLVLVVRAFNANAQTETNLYSFGSVAHDGANPDAGLVQGSDGNFYGTAIDNGAHGDGTVFRISPSGSYTNLYSFGSVTNDGQSPYGGLVQGSDGNFYGTTFYNGPHTNGTVFRISATGSYTNLYFFGGVANDGAHPYAGLVQGSDGNFYGTTFYGGTNANGTVFRISATGSYTNLHSFGSVNDGYYPYAALVQGSDGNFYSTTELGGTHGNGTVFRISATGSYSNLYSFGSVANDGTIPVASVLQGSDGSFYGTTYQGGIHGNGTVFRISPSGNYSNLYSFGSVTNDGANPQAGLVQGSDGNFYGTAFDGGAHGNGTVFRISPSGSYTNLYFFGSVANDGAYPYAGLVQGSDGIFYGTTQSSGNSTNCFGTGCGTVFKLTVPLSPPSYPINQITGVHIAATNIIFNIPSVAHETYQLQFSSSMKPTNWVNVSGVSVTNSPGALLTMTNFGGAVGPQGFYRFDITP